MHMTILSIHIIGAALLLIGAVYSIVQALRKQGANVKHSYVLAIGTTFQCVSGTMLAMQANWALATTCTRLGIYVAAVAMVIVYLQLSQKTAETSAVRVSIK